ncbi:MAG: hypothetical protein ACYDCK_14040 [Thermoplasmatota archaeon]
MSAARKAWAIAFVALAPALLARPDASPRGNIGAPRRRVWAVACLGILVMASSGCVVVGSQGIDVVASAPREAAGMTLFATTHTNAITQLSATQASYAIYYGDQVVYPPYGRGGDFTLDSGRGVVYVPYSLFVVGNGDYTIHVDWQDEHATTSVTVEKWVSYVYLHPADRDGNVVVDAQLSRSTGGSPTDRILASGELIFQLHYRGLKGDEDSFVPPQITTATDSSDTFTRVEIPRASFNAGSGWYSIDPIFHNSEAKGNSWVPADPTMAQRDPPWNWIYIR